MNRSRYSCTHSARAFRMRYAHTLHAHKNFYPTHKRLVLASFDVFIFGKKTKIVTISLTADVSLYRTRISRAVCVHRLSTCLLRRAPTAPTRATTSTIITERLAPLARHGAYASSRFQIYSQNSYLVISRSIESRFSIPMADRGNR